MTAPRTKRVLHLRELDPAKVHDYRKAHDAIWPELVELYRRCGVVDISCFIDGSTLAVMCETDVETHGASAQILAAHPLEVRWQDLMREYDQPGGLVRIFTEVYRQEPTATGDLRIPD